MALLTASEWLARAEEARQLADTLRDVGARHTMLTIAAGYEKMARRAALLGDHEPLDENRRRKNIKHTT